MISLKWEPMFRPFPLAVRRALTESLLAAWMDKNLQYPIAEYLPLPTLQHDYKPRASLGDISGGRVWRAAADFRAAGSLRRGCGSIAKLGKWRMQTARPASNTTDNQSPGSANANVADLDDRLDVGVVRNVALSWPGDRNKCISERLHGFAGESADRGKGWLVFRSGSAAADLDRDHL